ncbi:MAG: alpha/beta hydrolase [Bacteroidota bacterium]
MKKRIFILTIISLLSSQVKVRAFQQEPIILSQPVIIEEDDWKFEGTENLILLPENRNDPQSRPIALHFFRFPAREKSGLDPVAFLPAGPGEPYSVDVFFKGKRAEAWRFELNFVNQKRDVLLINQRGNSSAPGLPMSEFRYRWSNGGSLARPFDLARMNQNRREAYQKQIEYYQSKGVDLRGYDILHFVDDVEAIRKALGYRKLALIGNSFGSQWALAYMRRYPERVDRALLSGVEPLDNNYDDPEGIWKVLEKIDGYAQSDPQIKNDLPPEGLVAAFQTILRRLEAKPQKVLLEDEGEEYSIMIGADDLRFSRMNPKSRSYLDEIESWPKYIHDMYQGDFRVMAEASYGRIYNSSSLMINPLVNNSLGISAEREARINNRSAKKWLGDINQHYTSTRAICPAPKVGDDFRLPQDIDIPVILIQGDMDLSTPYENATSLRKYLKRGHLLTVERGFHNAKRALIFADLALVKKIYAFMNLDFEVVDFQNFKKGLPRRYTLPRFDFWPLKGKALFEKYHQED